MSVRIGHIAVGEHGVAPVLGFYLCSVIEHILVGGTGHRDSVCHYLHASVAGVGGQEHHRGGHRLVGAIDHGVGGGDLRRGSGNSDVQHLFGHRQGVVSLKGNGGAHIGVRRGTHIGRCGQGRKQQQGQRKGRNSMQWFHGNTSCIRAFPRLQSTMRHIRRQQKGPAAEAAGPWVVQRSSMGMVWPLRVMETTWSGSMGSVNSHITQPALWLHTSS